MHSSQTFPPTLLFQNPMSSCSLWSRPASSPYLLLLPHPLFSSRSSSHYPPPPKSPVSGLPPLPSPKPDSSSPPALCPSYVLPTSYSPLFQLTSPLHGRQRRRMWSRYAESWSSVFSLDLAQSLACIASCSPMALDSKSAKREMLQIE